MSSGDEPDLTLFLDILRTLERIGAPYMVIGGFAATLYGRKADLSPLTRDSRYRFAFARRIRQRIEWQGVEPFEAWCARPDDVIFGKLLAWDEGHSRKHRSDIYDMLVFHYLAADPTLIPTFDEAYLDAQAFALGSEVVEFWQSIKAAAYAEANRDEGQAS